MNTTPKSAKKRHHYIPIAYLNRFTDCDGKVFAYRKDEPQDALHLKPREIAFERYYYSQPLPAGGQDNNSLEDFFSTIETAWPPIVDRIEEGRNLNSDLLAIFMFVGMLRVRVPAARDLVETSLAQTVKASTKYLDRLGHLPPKPDGCEDILDHLKVAIDPHQSLAAMGPLAQGFGRIVDQLGFQIMHNEVGLSFITSDNPIVYFDPDVAEQDMLPYTVRPPHRRIELLFPISSRVMLHGHSDLKAISSIQYLHHVSLTSRRELKRFNRLIARFGYRFIFADSRGHEPLVQKYAEKSPVLKSVTVPGPDGGQFILHQQVFGPRRSKPKWKARSKKA